MESAQKTLKFQHYCVFHEAKRQVTHGRVFTQSDLCWSPDLGTAWTDHSDHCEIHNLHTLLDQHRCRPIRPIRNSLRRLLLHVENNGI